jgi:hypothetical protein
MDLTAQTIMLVREVINVELAAQDAREVVGVTCLAEGADSEFAQAVLEAGGKLEVLLPAPDYRDTRLTADYLPVFDSLIERATLVRYVDKASSLQAYARANEVLVTSIDQLFAVWDGRPSIKQGGGTADAVALARSRGIAVLVIWPLGAERTE